MIKGETSVQFQTTESRLEVVRTVEKTLQRLGRVSTDSEGSVAVRPKFASVFVDATIDGKLQQADEPTQYSVWLYWDVSPTAMTWILAVLLVCCTFGFSLLWPPMWALGGSLALRGQLNKTLRELGGRFEAPEALPVP
jgi:hypothetical protein